MKTPLGVVLSILILSTNIGCATNPLRDAENKPVSLKGYDCVLLKTVRCAAECDVPQEFAVNLRRQLEAELWKSKQWLTPAEAEHLGTAWSRPVEIEVQVLKVAVPSRLERVALGTPPSVVCQVIACDPSGGSTLGSGTAIAYSDTFQRGLMGLVGYQDRPMALRWLPAYAATAITRGLEAAQRQKPVQEATTAEKTKR